MIEQKRYDGEGMRVVYDGGDWVIGIKNYKVANDISTLKTLERHNKTDESFVLLEGACILVAYDDTKEGPEALALVQMEEHTVYTLPQGVWHTTIMKPYTKMVLIERSGTSMENSELLNLSDSLVRHVQDQLT